MIKLIASDMDGTLLDGKNGISPFNIKMIKEAQKRGIHFVIASGRAYRDILPILNKYDLKCACVTGNGAQYIDEEGQLMSAAYLPYSSALQVIDILNQHHIRFMIYCVEGNFSIEPVENVQDDFIARRLVKEVTISYEEAKEELRKRHSIFQMSKLNHYVENLKDKHIIKIEAFNIDIKRIEEAKNDMKKLKSVSYLSSFPDNVEITALVATKGKILLSASKLMNIQENEVMVIGDSYNDLSMFEIFENSVVVANGIEEVKKKAKYITTAYDQDGVGKAIERWAINE